MAVKSFASDLLCLLYVQWKIGDSRGGGACWKGCIVVSHTGFWLC